MQTANAAPRASARVPANPVDKLMQIRVAVSFKTMSAAAVRLFVALVAGSDGSGRIDVTTSEMVEMAGLLRGQHPDILLREMAEYALIEHDAGRGSAPYAIRVVMVGDDLDDEVDRVARNLRVARHSRA